jgi:predicted DNA-binding protein (UPF0251 family)
MPRPRHFRRVGCLPQSNYYKPRGIPLSVLQCVNLTIDELEAIRLADLEGLYQEDAAKRMNVSRQTFGRMLESAHKKIADALVNGKALLIEGGPIELTAAASDTADTAGPHRFRRGPGGRGRGHRGGRGGGR